MQKINRNNGEEQAAFKVATNGDFLTRGRGQGKWRGRGGRGNRDSNGSRLKYNHQPSDFQVRGRGHFDKYKVECFRCHGYVIGA